MNLLLRGNARSIPLADESVHCVICSPPYWGLRDYGTARWEGGDEGCDHQRLGTRAGQASTLRSDGRDHIGPYEGERNLTVGFPYRDTCGKCGARRVDRQLGLEQTPEGYVAAMVGVFREVWRVLRDDGTLWLNIGDSYAGSSIGGGNGSHGTLVGTHHADRTGTKSLGDRMTPGLKPKDLIGIPWRLALALQADGWYLRSEIIWAKPNPMPESVTDRPTKSHEQVFLLSKSERYFYDAEAMREPMALASEARYAYEFGGAKNEALAEANKNGIGVRTRPIGERDPGGGRNLRSVWTIATEAYPGAHFATYPRKLIEPCIKAGTSERGCCPRCRAPWVRMVEREVLANGRGRDHIAGGDAMGGNGWEGIPRASLRTSTLGWQPSCQHQHDPIPAIILDPFAGSGTTLVVAEALGRRAIGLDLSREYLTLAQRRINRPHAAVPRPGRAEDLPLFREYNDDDPGARGDGCDRRVAPCVAGGPGLADGAIPAARGPGGARASDVESLGRVREPMGTSPSRGDDLPEVSPLFRADVACQGENSPEGD